MIETFCSGIPWHIVATLTGLCVGALLNRVIYHLSLTAHPQTGSLPRSHCSLCQTALCWSERIPLVSWFLPDDRCPSCLHLIRYRYPLIEAIVATMALMLSLFFPPGADWLLLFSAFALLMALTLIDLDTLMLPDVLTQPLLWLGLSWHMLQHPLFLPDATLGAITGYLSLAGLNRLCIHWKGKVVTGQGEVKMLAALGAWCGWQQLAEVVLVAALCGLLLTLIRGKCRNIYFPFGPGLAIAGAWRVFTNLMVAEWAVR